MRDEDRDRPRSEQRKRKDPRHMLIMPPNQEINTMIKGPHIGEESQILKKRKKKNYVRKANDTLVTSYIVNYTLIKLGICYPLLLWFEMHVG